MSSSLIHSSLRRAESRVHELEAESLASALPEGFRTHSSEKSVALSGPKQPNVFKTHACIAGGAIAGVLARKGLTALTTYDGAYLGGVVWANFAACFVMGLAVESNALWLTMLEKPHPYAAKGSIPLYVGITTGFCGTCSSFSSFILEAFNKAANTLPTTYAYPNAGYGVMDALAVAFGQVSVSACGFHAGKHLVTSLEHNFAYAFSKSVYRATEIATVVLSVAAYVVVVVLAATKNDGSWRAWTLLCVFAPLGAFLRFHLSKHLNGRVPDFPLGTFTANVLGCILLAIFTLLARGKAHVASKVPLVSLLVGCHVLAGLDDGFCGALTTVSTFVVELFGLADPYAYVYGVASVVVGFVCVLLILGPYNWAVGLTSLVC